MVKMLRTVALVLDVGASQTAIQLFHHLESKFVDSSVYIG